MSLLESVTPHIYRSASTGTKDLLKAGSSWCWITGVSGSSIRPGFNSNKEVISFTKIRLVPTVILCVRSQAFSISWLSGWWLSKWAFRFKLSSNNLRLSLICFFNCCIRADSTKKLINKHYSVCVVCVFTGSARGQQALLGLSHSFNML